MYRIDSDGSESGAWSAGNPATGQPGTVIDPVWLEAVQEELAQLIEGCGGVLSKANNAQILAALVTGTTTGYPGGAGWQDDAGYPFTLKRIGNRVVGRGRAKATANNGAGPWAIASSIPAAWRPPKDVFLICAYKRASTGAMDSICIVELPSSGAGIYITPPGGAVAINDEVDIGSLVYDLT